MIVTHEGYVNVAAASQAVGISRFKGERYLRTANADAHHYPNAGVREAMFVNMAAFREWAGKTYPTSN